MMTPRALAALIAALAVGGAVGYMAGKGSTAAPSGSPAVSRPTLPLPKPPRKEPTVYQLPEEISDLVGAGPITPENANARTFAVLREPDPVRRHAALSLLLLSMTPENAHAMRQATVDITKQTGRRQDAEWSMLMKQFGRVLGGPGLREIAEKKEPGLNHAMEGYAMADPAAAKVLMGELVSGDRQLFTAWVRGAALSDPRAVFQHFASSREGFLMHDASAAVEQAVQAMGVHDTALLLGEVAVDMEHKPGENQTGAAPLYEALTDNLFNQHWQAGTTKQMLDWLEQQRQSPLMHSGITMRAVKDATLAGSHADALSFLERMSPERPHQSHCLHPYYKANPQVLASLSEADYQRALNLLPLGYEKWRYEMSVALREHNPARAMELEQMATSVIPLEQLAPGAQPFIVPQNTTTNTTP
jgi:hypothetical protein